MSTFTGIYKTTHDSDLTRTGIYRLTVAGRRVGTLYYNGGAWYAIGAGYTDHLNINCCNPQLLPTLASKLYACWFAEHGHEYGDVSDEFYCTLLYADRRGQYRIKYAC